jgi:site-specific recombinase XerD
LGLPTVAERARRLAEVLLRYLDAIALTQRPNSVARYRYLLWGFLRFLEAHHPRVESFSDLRRRHIESWLRHEATRKGHHKDGPLRRSSRRKHIIHLRRFLEDLRAWGWEEGIPEILIQRSDLPPPDQYLPRPLSQEVDQTIRMELRAIGTLPALGLLLARATGIRIGELRNLELDCLQEFPDHQWTIRVPLGKLHSERVIPADAETVKLVEEIRRLRGEPPPLPHPDTGKPTHFLLVRPNGRRPSHNQIQYALDCAAQRARINEHVWPHRLRHTYATEMLRSGMSLPVLMRLLGHRTLSMTLRYAQVTQADVHRAYLEAVEVTKARYQIPKQPALEPSPKGGAFAAAGIVSLLATVASQMEAYRRDLKSPLTMKRIRRLVERLRRTARDFVALTRG